MFFRSIRWRIAVSYLVLILAAMLTLAFYASDQVRRARLDDLENQLLGEARLIADGVATLDVMDQAETTRALSQRWAALLDARITVMAVDGTVLADSHNDPAQMDNHRLRPEMQQALTSGQGSSMRFSKTMGYEMMYAAQAVELADGQKGVVRVALSLKQIESSVNRLRRAVLSAALVTALLAVFLAVFIAERTTRPVRELTQAAERFAAGDLSARLFVTTKDEIGQLAQTFNLMVEQLREKVSTLGEEQDRLAAVLEHMADGVLITDENGWVQLINPAAAELMDTEPADALGKTFAQVVRHHQLIELWQRCQAEGKEQVEALEINYRELFLQAIVSPFQEAHAQGYLVILQDLTRIRRLETVRRDFISNISHELRTPLAGLKALVDTLRDGALEDPPAARRFLNRMETEVDALTQMVQELLELSRIESGQAPLRMVPTSLQDLIVDPVDRLLPQAERAGLSLNVELPPDLPRALADAERVQQVITNLVHNAIKFTPEGGHVTVSASRAGRTVRISVEDTGVGIPAEDLPRIFERFYKSDRARSGGGSGLGLAIAKHIVQGHGGHIWAESVEGQGSTFHFSLPAVE